jgi:hypothetical protein
LCLPMRAHLLAIAAIVPQSRSLTKCHGRLPAFSIPHTLLKMKAQSAIVGAANQSESLGTLLGRVLIEQACPALFDTVEKLRHEGNSFANGEPVKDAARPYRRGAWATATSCCLAVIGLSKAQAINTSSRRYPVNAPLIFAAKTTCRPFHDAVANRCIVRLLLITAVGVEKLPDCWLRIRANVSQFRERR